MSLNIRNITIGDDQPKICVPVTCREDEDIISLCRLIVSEHADILEWRADCFTHSKDKKCVVSVLNRIRDTVGNMPVLFTYRTKADGGETGVSAISADDYMDIMLSAAESGYADIIDVELSKLKSLNDTKCFLASLRSSGCRIIISKHFFDRTPSDTDMDDLFYEMNSYDADILKLAVMPNNRNDVVRLLSATDRASSAYYCPVITMSMGKLGLVSRVIGEITGSSVTFASVGEISAPGQIPLLKMKQLLELFEIY